MAPISQPPDSLNRRRFLQTALAAAAVPAALRGERLAAAERDTGDRSTWQLNYILASCMYGTTRLDELLPEVARSGARQIDIWPRPHADHREQIEARGHARFEELLQQHDVQLGMITRYDLGPYGLEEELGVLAQFGGRLLVTGAGRGSGDSPRQRVRSFVESMQPHVEAAAERGITLAIENHANSLIDSPDSLRWFADFNRWPQLGIALAPYHLPQDERLLADLITQLGPSLVHFYAWQHGMGCMEKLPKPQEMLQMPGRGPLDFAPLLAALREIGYAGWTEVFMHPVPRGIAILETTAQVTAAINEARSYLQQCVDRLPASPTAAP